MIRFKKDVYVAQLEDLGYSGEARPTVDLGYFTDEDVARGVAEMEAGIEGVTGKRGRVTTETIDIVIYERRHEYESQAREDLVEAAKGKLSREELAALKIHFRENARTFNE
jgi:hypothetical protein